jgi:iron(III) transport system ATP-binding protein
MSFLELKGLRKRYGDVDALDGIDLAVKAGGRTAVVGPSGSGKTTLLRLIAGFDAPDEGSVTLDGDVLANGAASVPAHRRGVGVVAQDGALFPHLTIADNVGFGLDRRDPQRGARIAELTHMVGLDAAMLTRKPDELSGGQQQRVALARALARKPRLMLLDEPFSALDVALRVATRKAVADLLSAAGITTILVTHDQAEALSFADQVAVMRDGRLSQVGDPRELYLRPRDAMIAEFLGEAIVLPADVGDGWAACALGRVSVGSSRRRGPARIMLRPEQVALKPAPAGPELAGSLRGRVAEIDFGGAACTVTVDLVGVDIRLRLRGSAMDAVPVGATVEIDVTGNAHVFDAAEQG